MNHTHFATQVEKEVSLLAHGKPLEALEYCFAADGKMYANDLLFAQGLDEARKKQEGYILAASEIAGKITDLFVDEATQLCVFRNRTSFVTDGQTHQINGLVWQQWKEGKVAVERYYDGDMMHNLIERGVLLNPSMLSLLNRNGAAH